MVPRRCLHAGLESRAGSRAATGTRRWRFSSKDIPTHEPQIRAFHERWDETVSGVIEDNVALLQRLREAGVPNYCITNFSSPEIRAVAGALSVPLGLRRHRRLGRRAPPEARSGHLPTAPRPLWPRRRSDCVFIDDSKANVEGAREVGMHAIHFVEPIDLAAELRALRHSGLSALALAARIGPSRGMRAFDTPLPIDEVLADLTATPARAAERGARRAARRRQDHPGAAGAARRALGRRAASSSCSSRAGSPPAPRPTAWRGRSARSVGETVGLRVRLGSKISRRTRIEVVTEGVFARMILDDPGARRRRRRALRRVPRALPRCRSRPRARARCARRPARGSAPPRHVGDPRRRARRAAARRGARHRIARAAPFRSRRAISGATRTAASTSRSRMRSLRALRAESRLRPGLPAGPGGDPPGRRPFARAHRAIRPSTSRRSTARSTAASRICAVSPAQPGRRKVVLATSIAETSLTIEGVRVVDRFRPRPRAGLRARYRPDAARDRARLARRRRPAPRPRRPHGAGRLLPPLGGGRRPARSSPSRARKSSPPISAPLLLDCAAWGVADPTTPRLPRSAAGAGPEGGAGAAASSSARSTARAASPRRAAACATCPCRRASPAWCCSAGERGQARDAADLAAVLVERGLGGDAVDLAERVERFRRDRSQRARGHAAHGRGLGASGRRTAPRSGEPRSVGALLTLAYPDRIAKARGKPGEFLMANGRGASLEAHERLAPRALSSPSPRSPAAPPRRASSPPPPITPDEIEAGRRSAHRAARRDRLRPAGAGAAGPRASGATARSS